MQAPYDLERLEWDAWNRDHIAKHDVSQDEVEEVVSGMFVALQSYKQRTVLLGPTRAGRMLAVVLGPVPGKPGVYYTFSARPASRKERRYYQSQRGADE